jgi:outer membrane receptor protein involved in Fe transport
MVSRKRRRAVVCLVAGLLWAVSAPSFAQEDALRGVGVIRGTVTSGADGKPIPVVSVQASGDSSSGSATTDERGQFAIELIPGVYRIVFSHPEYDERSYLNVDVAPETSKRADVTLRKGGGQASVSGVEQLVVTGRYVRRTVDQSRYSESVLDVLSAADFSVTGDSEVADALSRVTGVTVVDDKYVYVRGLGERYSSTLFNGALLPSPEPSRRVVPLDLFPSGVMEQLSVQKTYSPYLPADFSGGSLQMTTRSIPAERELSLSVSTEYNTETTFRRSVWTEGDGFDWAGLSAGGQRELPSILEDLSVDGRLPNVALLTDEELRAIGLAMNRNYDTDDITIPPNIGIDGSYADSRKLPHNGSFGWLFGARYKNDWQFTREKRRTSKLLFEDGKIRTGMANNFEEDETVNTIGYAGLATSEWKINRDQKVNGTVFVTRLTDKRFLNANGFLDENARTVDQTTEEWEERQLWSAQLIGSHRFRRFADVHVDWGVTYSEASRDKPLTRFYEYELNDDGRYLFSRPPAGNSQTWERLDDEAWDVNWNAMLPLDFGPNLSTKLKTGVKYFEKTRNSELRKFRFNPRFPAQDFFDLADGGPGDVFDDDNIGRGKWELEEITQFTDSYDAEEIITATYFQTDTEFWRDWRLSVGFRYEDSEQTVDTRAVQGGSQIVSKLTEDYILPAATLTWMFRDDMQLRAGYSQTINRPDLREISPAAYLDPETRDPFVGNPNLQIAEIRNYDLRWEWYYAGLDNLQVAAFYKEFTDPIEQTLLAQGATAFRTYQNAESADLYGVELSWRQGLGIVSDWTRDFYLVVNGAWMDSEVTVDTSVGAQTNEKRRLQGQSEWVVNTQLTYENLVRDMQATVAFNAAGERLSDVGISGLDDSWEQPVPVLDFIYRQGFELWNQPLSFRLKAQNLIDPVKKIERSGIVEKESRSGRSFDFSIEWTF